MCARNTSETVFFVALSIYTSHSLLFLFLKKAASVNRGNNTNKQADVKSLPLQVNKI